MGLNTTTNLKHVLRLCAYTGFIWATSLATQAVAATYYVSTVGVDSTSGGTLLSPWKTIPYALKQVPAGSTIQLRAGTYSGGFTVAKQGTTLEAYPHEVAKIAAPTTDSRVEVSVRIQVDADNVTLRNLDISGGYYYAVKTETNWDSGPEFMPYHGPKNLLIENSKLHDSGRDVIKLTFGADYARILKSEIYNSGRRDPSNAEGVDAVNVNALLVQDNYIHDITTNGIYVKGGSTSPVIERNLIKRVGHGGIGCGQDTGYEWFELNSNPELFESIDCMVRNNIVVNSGSAGIFSQASLRSKILNNTLLNVATTYQAGLVVMGVPHSVPGLSTPRNRLDQDATIINNVVVVNSRRPVFSIRDFGGGTEGAVTLKNNLYHNSSTAALFSDEPRGWAGGLSAWKAHTGQDQARIEAAPMLDATTHRLAPGSPAIDVGYGAAEVADDIDGKPRPAGRAPDIGASEFGAAAAISTLPVANSR